MLGLLSTGKELTIGLVGARRAGDRGFTDYRNNIATFTKALITNTSVQYNTNTNKIYIAPGILKRIRAQTLGVTRR